ncbi:MAG: DciA family protein [Candidatus Omnitrophota bacterium]
MENIKDIVHSVVKNISEQRPHKENDLQVLWEQAAGTKTAKATHIVGMKEGRLLVVTDSPARLFDLTLHKKKLLKNMQEKWSELKDISFKIGKVK